MTALVAETLLESLDLEPDVEVSEGWREESRRRCVAIDQGVVPLAQGEQLIADLRAKYDWKYQFDFVPVPVGMPTPAPSRSSEFFRKHQDSPLSHRPRIKVLARSVARIGSSEDYAKLESWGQGLSTISDAVGATLQRAVRPSGGAD